MASIFQYNLNICNVRTKSVIFSHSFYIITSGENITFFTMLFLD